LYSASRRKEGRNEIEKVLNNNNLMRGGKAQMADEMIMCGHHYLGRD